MGLLRSHLWNIRLEALEVLRYIKISGPNKVGTQITRLLDIVFVSLVYTSFFSC